MTQVTPIEPHLRRRDAARRARATEAAVAIPLFREARESVAPEAPSASVAHEPVDQRALAARFFPLAALTAAALYMALSATGVLARVAWLENADAAAAVFTSVGIATGLLVATVPELCRGRPRRWVGLALLAGCGFGGMAVAVLASAGHV